MGRPTKEYANLSLKERRAAAKEKAANEVKALQKRAKRMKDDLDTVAKKLGDKPGKEGRLLSQERVATMEKNTKDIAEKNVIFEPNDGPQTDFLAAPETDVLYGGAAGGGKSYAMIVDPLRYAHEHDHRALILRKTMPELRELIDKTRELYPQAFPGAKYKETEKVWVFPSGAKIMFGFLEKDSDVYRYQGQAFSWIGFDEITHLASEYPWQYLQSRLRTTNPNIVPYMRATANPGGPGHEWVKKRYISPADYNTSFIGDDDLSRRFIPARLKDNPYLTKDGRYEKMLKAMSEIERRRLLEGDWDIIAGGAFPEFDRSTHVIAPFDIPPSWNRIKGIDYGYTSPSACVWAAIDPDDGTVVIYKELYERGLEGSELKQRINELEQGEMRAIPGVLDTAAWNRTGYSGPTIGEELCKHPYGHKLRPADKNRLGGKVQVHAHLRKDKDTGKPRLLIFNTCTNLIRELVNIPLSDTNSEDVDTHADDHAYDALRYLLMSRPKQQNIHGMALQIKSSVQWQPQDEVFGY